MQWSFGRQGSIRQKGTFAVFVSTFQTAELVSFQPAKPEDLIRGQSLWDLRWKIWHWDRFFSDYFCSPLSGSFPLRLHIHCRLYASLSKGKTGEMWKLPERNTLSEIGSFRQKKNYFQFFCFHSSKATLNFYGLLCGTRVRNFWTLRTRHDLPECTNPIGERLCLLMSSLV
jgi:hypothetical protein